MADPVSGLAIASTVATAVGGATSAYGSSLAAGAKADQYMYQSGVASLNRKISLENADYARRVGDVQQMEYGMKASQQRSKTIATQSGRGLDITQGSPAEVVSSMEDLSQFDQQMIQHNAARKAYGHEIEATKYGAEADNYRRAAESTKKASTWSTIGSLIGTAGAVAGKWMQYGNVFGGGGGAPAYAEDNKY